MSFGTNRTSFSQVRRYEQCPKSFELHYIRREPALENDAAKFGKVMHATCEQVVRAVMRSGETTALSVEEATKCFERACGASGLAGLALFQEGAEMAASFVRDQGVVDGKNVLALEQRFVLPLGRYAVLGFIDRVDKVDDETVEIIDYKTNQQLFTRDELDGDLQLPLYAAAAKALWPWARRVKLTYWMLRHRVRVPIARTHEQIAAALKYVEAMADQARTAKAFPAKVGGHCAYCDHRDQCDAYAGALRGERRQLVAVDPDSLEAVAREREDVAGLVRILDGRKRELETVLRAHLKGTSEVKAAGMRYRMVPTRSQAEYPLEATVDTLAAASGMTREALMDRLAIVDTEALGALLGELKEQLPKRQLTMLRAELEARAVRTVTPRFTASEDNAA